MSFHDFEIAYLRSQRLGRLATAKPDGTLQNSPVGFTYNAELGTIDIGGFDNTNSRKYRNVADNGRAAFVVDDLASVDPWRVRCPEVRGRAETVGDLIRLHPTRIISFGIDQPDAEPHALRPHARDVG
ncbi:PPOX class F420-dependent oxidoreductase [Pseudonocardia hydrocarbonoxydans]|uniref:PPOX class F420-dependent oxidoreductase n=1 Tax=Pseudonocardia hydrocarbonoxydans TaxID=76726 RepID=A0A4Y3WKV3_9PSEU|nr:PPOX class F420-dependent oxidoreductase [Pseudonocardia hydrocarbonoxydans]GEC19522.1 PPOX class F420-dependent oxidoreductase [Pseudonocardia hydrocarbonoxydans]